MTPARLVNLELARARFGARIDRLRHLYLQADPLADDAVQALAEIAGPQREHLVDCALAGSSRPEIPEALARFAESLREVPLWADAERIEAGGRALLRTGILGATVLMFRSLPMGYASPAGNKPLTFSGRLTENAPRRLAETGRFVHAVCQPGGLRVGGSGFVATARVRLMHAQVRRFLKGSPRWDEAAWGVPINQVDMAGTALLFSLHVTEGVRALGAPFSDADAEDLQHLWRYEAHLMGVADELLVTSVAEARTLWEMITVTQPPPDADSAALARALIESGITRAETESERKRARRFVPVAYGLSRHLVGDAVADALGYPKDAWRFAGPALYGMLGRAGGLVRTLPGADWLLLEAGLAYWHRAISLAGAADARFEMPDRVQHA